MQDNKTFQIFKQLLASIINVFEEDRSYIAREMTAYDRIKYGPERDKKAADELAKRIMEQSRERKKQQEEKGSEQSKENIQTTKKNRLMKKKKRY